MDETNFVSGNIHIECKILYDEKRKFQFLTILVTKNKEMRPFPPTFFLDYLLQSYYLKIENSKDYSKKFTEIYTAKSEIIHYISRFKHEIKGQVNMEQYDFDDILLRINSVIDKQKAELDAMKYELEVQKLRTETRWYKEPVFIITFGIAVYVFSIEKCGYKGMEKRNNASTKDTGKYSFTKISKK